jgi:ComF family protein
MRQVVHGARELLFPRTCLGCQSLLDACWPDLACSTCLHAISRVPAGGCLRCGAPLGAAVPCSTCHLLDPAIQSTRSWCWADDPTARTLLHAFKYDGWPALAGALARCMSLLVPNADSPRQRCLIGVPLTPARLRERGYNQADLLAGALARRWQCTVSSDALLRVRESPSQTRLTRMKRFANVADAFQVNASDAARLHGRSCVLVDDVMTTGATLNACAVALRSVGIENITCVTFGRARDPRTPTPA